MLLSLLAVHWGLRREALDWQAIRSRGIALGGTRRHEADLELAPLHDGTEADWCQLPPAERLVWFYLCAAGHRGSDVRLETGLLMRPSAWPRMGIEPLQWIWRTIVASQWQRGAHINELECRAAYLALRWRARRVSNHGHRCLHLLDSAVTIGILSKRRSSAHVLNRVTRKFNVVEIASGIRMSFAFVRSERNPADRPSRRWKRPSTSL